MDSAFVWLIVIGIAAAVIGELDVHWCRVRSRSHPPEDVQ